MTARYIALLLLIVPSPAATAERNFQIAGEGFTEAEILDARAQPELDGTSSVRITFTDTASKRILIMTQRLQGKSALVTLDSEAIAEPVVKEPIRDSVLQLSGPWSIDSATALARKISGKEPLPDSLE